MFARILSQLLLSQTSPVCLCWRRETAAKTALAQSKLSWMTMHSDADIAVDIFVVVLIFDHVAFLGVTTAAMARSGGGSHLL